MLVISQCSNYLIVILQKLRLGEEENLQKIILSPVKVCIFSLLEISQASHLLSVFIWCFPQHTLPNLNQICAISEVIILDNDQHQHRKKQYQQSTGLFQRLNNNMQLLSIGFIVSGKFLSDSVFVCYLQVCLAWKTISCQIDKRNRVKHGRI